MRDIGRNLQIKIYAFPNTIEKKLITIGTTTYSRLHQE